MPKITVYITNHNYQDYIEEAVESVLSQSFQDFELLIIDDGSEDNSRKVINKYQDRDRVKIILQERKGLNVTNNIALKQAKGEFIVRLDADDYLHPEALEKMEENLSNNPKAAMIFPDYFNIDKFGNIINTVRRHNFSKEVSLFDLPAHGACTMIRTNLLRELGGYDENFDRQDGYDLWLKVIFKYRILNLNEPLFFYRQHGSNLTSNSYDLLKTRAAIKEKHLKQRESSSIKVLSIIPFRGPDIDSSSKPLEKLNNKELISWTLEEAIKSKNINRIVATSPDKKSLDFISKYYSKDVLIDNRPSDLAKVNKKLDETVIRILNEQEKKGERFDIVTILYIDYPFKRSWQIDEAINTLKLFNVDSVDGVIPDNRFYYRHLGKGLEPLVEGGGLKLERDQLYRRVGGVHCIKTSSFRSNAKLLGNVIGHINFDSITGFQIRSDLDWVVAQSLSKEHFLDHQD
mgnify:FL=1|tara:strand:+ start:22046 stop:23425 length:1380 start_codon:yes stop_codon:yes gene_type:complete